MKKIKWPLCYIGGVCGLYIFNCSAVESIADLINVDIISYSQVLKSRKDWELIVAVAIALRCLNSSLNGKKGIFVLCEEIMFPYYKIVEIPPENKTLNSCSTFIDEVLSKLKPNSFVLLVPTHSRITHCDILLAYKSFDLVSKIIGFQVKVTNVVNTKDEIPVWIEAVYVVEGKVSDKGERKKNKFIFLIEEQVLNLLGFSLSAIHAKE